MYVNENGNGNMNGKKKGPVALLGEIATDFLGATIPNPLIASAFRVVSRNVSPNVGGIYNVPTAVATPRQLPGIYGVLQQKILAQRQAAAAAPKPSINVVSLPNGTAIPVPSPSSNGGAPLPAWTPSMEAGTQGSGGGSSFGPPPDYPTVEVGTLPAPDGGGDSTGGGPSLAGLTSGSPLLLLAAAAAFFLLGDNKKRRRR